MKFLIFNPYGQNFYQNVKYCFAGGAELQLYLLARELVKSGSDVEVVVFEVEHATSREDLDEIDRKVIVRAIRRNVFDEKKMGNPLSQLISIIDLWRTMWYSKADFYLTRYYRSFAPLGLFCLVNQKRYILMGAHDEDFDNTSKSNKDVGILIRVVSYFVIRFANYIFIQNSNQQATLHKNYSKNGIIINNFIQGINQNNKINNRIVLWVGRFEKWKHPELLIDIAEKVINAKICIIGHKIECRNSAYSDLLDRLAGMHNVEIIGYVPIEKIQSYYAESTILINTSDAEGFPNTFLQAWANGVPVISLYVNPNNIVTNYEIGIISGNIFQMIDDINRLLDDELSRNKLGKNGIDYLQLHHDNKKIIHQFLKSILD